MTTWQYVAGFFDGEGCAGNWGRGGQIRFANNDLRPLIAIRDFLGAGRIYEHPPGKNGRRQTAYVLCIAKVEDLRRITPMLLHHCLLRREQLQDVLTSLEGRRSQHETWGRLESIGVEEIRRLYWEEGMSGPAIARQLGMKSDSVHRFMKRHGLPMRSNQEALSMAGRHSLRNVSPDLIHDLYWSDGLSPAVIAAHFGVTDVAIRKFMARHAIPRRSRAAAYALRAKL